MANVRSTVVWQLQADDARLLAPHFGSLVKPDDLQSLEAFERVCPSFG